MNLAIKAEDGAWMMTMGMRVRSKLAMACYASLIDRPSVALYHRPRRSLGARSAD
jgi:hypothetical protein